MTDPMTSVMSVTPDLKPCPFCGSAAVFSGSLSSPPLNHVLCTGCPAGTRPFPEYQAGEAWNTRSAMPSTDRTLLEQAASGLDHVAATLNEVHALSDVGDPKFDADMLGQIAACERGASLLRRTALAMPEASDRKKLGRCSICGERVRNCTCPNDKGHYAEAERKCAEMREALTPSAETKAAYIGEFKFPFTADLGDDGEETISMTVPWTTIKEIMAAIRERAGL